MSKNCIFCKIIQGEIPAERIYENEGFICIKDIQPKTQTHLLVIPKQHIESLDEAYPENDNPVGGAVELLSTSVKVARKMGLLPRGYRTIINTGTEGGQSVPHLHLHILAGKGLRIDLN